MVRAKKRLLALVAAVCAALGSSAEADDIVIYNQQNSAYSLDGEDSLTVTSNGEIAAPAGQRSITVKGTNSFIEVDGEIIGNNREAIYLERSALTGDLIVNGNIGPLTPGTAPPDDSVSYIGIKLEENGSRILGRLVNNGFINTRREAIEIKQGSLVNGGIINTGTLQSYDSTTLAITRSTIFGGINNSGTILNLNSNYAINIDGGTVGGGIFNSGTIKTSTLNQDAFIIGGSAIVDGGFWNSGTIEAFNGREAFKSQDATLYGGFNNSGVIRGAVVLGRVYDGIINTGSVSATGKSGISIRKQITGGVYNSGTITGTGEYSFGFDGSSNIIDKVVNTGSIVGERGDMRAKNLTTLENFQGQTGSGGSALTLLEGLPLYYNMIAYGDRYGQLQYDDQYDEFLETDFNDGRLTFGISGGEAEHGVLASQLKRRTYVDVMTGVEVDWINNEWAQTTTGDHRSFGTHDGMLWMLRQRGHEDPTDAELADSWNLEVLDLASDFFASTVSVVGQHMTDLQGKIDTGSGSGYDCDIASGKKGCVGVKGVYADLGDEETATAGTVLGAYRFGNHLKVGGFIEQDVSGEDPDNVEYEPDMPSLGGYFAYRQNEDDTGIKAKSSAAVSSGTAKLSRTNLLGSAELASGKANLDGYALAQTLGYGVGISNHAVVTPVAGIAFISTKRSGYTENGDTAGLQNVPDDDVFTYDNYTEQTTLGTLGVALDYDSYERLSVHGGLVMSYVLRSEADELSASSSVAGLERVSIQSGDSLGDIGLTGYLGIGFDVTDSQRITLDYSAWHSVDADDYAQYAMLGWTFSFGGDSQELGK